MSERGAEIWVLVSNDLTHDQRVLKTCRSLASVGFKPQLVGRLLPASTDPPKAFPAHRLMLRFHAGALFYALLQIRMTLFLLRRARGAAGVWANDLDTLLPAFLVAKWFRLPLVFDSHELFTEAAGLTGRPVPRAVWVWVERLLVPNLKVMLTVNDSIADVFHRRYRHGKAGRPLVVRNMPMKRSEAGASNGRAPILAAGLSIQDGPLGIIQGAFLDADRGVREAVEVLAVRPSWQLLVVGAGPEWDWASAQTSRFPGRLHLLPKQPYETLAGLTRSADWGFSLDKPAHGNYIMSLPNKLFDYIHAGVPVVASPLVEVARIVEQHGVGVLIEDHAPENIAAAVDKVLARPRVEWGRQCEQASAVLNWEAEEPLLREALVRAGFKKPG